MKADEPTWFHTPWPLNSVLAGVAVTLCLILGSPFELLEHRWLDQLLRLRLAAGFAPAVDKRIIHLDITHADLDPFTSVESEYQAIGQLIRETKDLGADLIVLDVIYTRGSRETAQPILDAIEQNPGVVLAEGLAALPGAEKNETRISSFPFLPARYSPAGLVNIRVDRDGVCRHYEYLQKTSAGWEPSLALAAYFELRNIRWPEEVTFSGDNTVSWQELSPDGTQMVSRKLKLPSKANLPLLNFRGGWSTTGPAAFGHLGLNHLHEFRRQYDKGADMKPLEGKILFVSYAASGIGDFGAMPLGTHQPLVLLHSTAFNDLIQDSLLERTSRTADALMLASVLLMGLGAWLTKSKKGLIAFWLAGIAAVIFTGIAVAAQTRWILPTVSVTLVWTLALIAELLRRHTYEIMERLKLRTIMNYYFSPKALQDIMAHPGSVEPKQAELTVLLTDLRNFTTLSEILGARGIFNLCSKVFEVQTKAVMDEDGSLGHFLGDQFLCYWEARKCKSPVSDHALRASLALIKAMEKLRGELSPEIQKYFGYGVALHSGTAMIGNIGSRQKMDYGLLGDLVNSAARVESLTKQYQVPFIITREVYNHLTEPPPCRILDRVVPVGKLTAVELLEVRHPLTPVHFEQLAAEYQAASEEYYRGNFGAAAETFRKLAAAYNDGPSRLLAKRCEEFANHVPENWTGVYQLTSK